MAYFDIPHQTPMLRKSVSQFQTIQYPNIPCLWHDIPYPHFSFQYPPILSDIPISWFGVPGPYECTVNQSKRRSKVSPRFKQCLTGCFIALDVFRLGRKDEYRWSCFDTPYVIFNVFLILDHNWTPKKIVSNHSSSINFFFKCDLPLYFKKNTPLVPDLCIFFARIWQKVWRAPTVRALKLLSQTVKFPFCVGQYSNTFTNTNYVPSNFPY